MIKISTSILSSNDRITSIKKLNSTNTDYLHIDVMDGIFVENYQFPQKEINDLIKYSTKPIDIHLMVENPNDYIDKLNDSNIEFITIHLEINQNLHQIIKNIKNKGYKVGLSIKPATNLDTLKPYLQEIDLILVMSVNPGLGGQEFIPSTIERLKEISHIKNDIIIEVDGGINKETINLIKPYSDIAVVGSYIINNQNYNEVINNLKN